MPTTTATTTPTTTKPTTSTNSLLTITELDPPTIRRLLAACADAAITPPSKTKPPLHSRIIANLFFEDSTRTRLSFSIAAIRLGAQVVDLTTAGSSVNKGESLIDTIKTVDAMHPDLIIIRHKDAGAPAIAARHAKAPIINAGDGRHEHPTQALIDALTLAESFNLINLNQQPQPAPTNPDLFDFTNKHIAIVGDIISSRVARSATAVLTALGARITLVGPPPFCPPTLTALKHPAAPDTLQPAISHDLDKTLPTADAVMMLRVQFERHPAPPTSPSPPTATHQTTHVAGTPTTPPTPKLASTRDYAADYQLTPKRAATIAADRPSATQHKHSNNNNTNPHATHAPILHPGPINRGLEIHPDSADAHQSKIVRQVELGIPVRAATILWALNIKPI